MRRPALTAAGVAAALALTGCAASSTTGATSPTSPAPSTSSSATGPGSPSPVASVVKVAGDAWSHVHNLAYDGPALLLGTHEGLYRQVPGQPPQLLSETPFDRATKMTACTRWAAPNPALRSRRRPGSTLSARRGSSRVVGELVTGGGLSSDPGGQSTSCGGGPDGS